MDAAAVGVIDVQPRSAPGHAVTVSAAHRDRVFEWASITKVVTALTVLDAAADGVVDLGDPVGPPGSSLAHLLAHASGVGSTGGEQLSPVGARRTYSNRGYELAAGHLEAAAGRAFDDELRERILDPLGMQATRLAGSPAHGLRGPIEDLARLAAELAAPRVLQPEIVAMTSTPAFPTLAGVLPGYGRHDPNLWGLGCEIRGTKQPHWTAAGNSPQTFGHFGQAGGFVWVDPVAQVACVCLSATRFGPWAVTAWPVLSAAVLAATSRR